MLTKLFIVSLCVYTICCVPIKSPGEIKQNVIARKWLSKYGYESSYSEVISEKQLAASIKNMQTFANLPVTGVLDDATLKQMTKPRCGRHDPILKVDTRGKRFVHQGTNWKQLFGKIEKKELKWTLLNSGQSLSYSKVLTIMREALRMWHIQTNIDFIEIPLDQVGRGTNRKDIEILISFESWDHEDPYPFDGEGGTLAHAFYPLSNKGLSGDVHFDDSEHYSYRSEEGKNLLWVATHELGHSLGLEHSNIKAAVMYPWYTKYKPGFSLHEDDIFGIQSLYGSRTKPMPGIKSTTSTITTEQKTTTTITTKIIKSTSRQVFKNKCPTGGEITAIYYSQKYGRHIAFSKKDKIYLLDYPNKIVSIKRISYLPKSKIGNPIDAVYTTDVIENRERTIYFAGDKYYVYRDFYRISGPHSLSDTSTNPLKLTFPLWVKKIDAVMTWFRNGRTFFFSGEYYWRYNNKRMKLDSGYPKLIRNEWKGLPGKVDAAFSSKYTKKTFFIIGKKYYHFNDQEIMVSAVYDVKNFLKCNGASSIQTLASG